MGISTNIYEYETRPVTSQECALEKAPTIQIAYQDVTMKDMFERPKHVAELKQLQEVIDKIHYQIVVLHRQGLTPTAVLVDPVTERLLMTARSGVYTPAYMTMNKITDTFMALDIAVISGSRDVQYIRVVV